MDPQGRLKLCPLQRQTIGSLWESSLEELVARGAAEKFRAAVPAFCRPCPHQGECLGGCGAAAEWVFGRPDELDPFLAQHVMPEFSQRVAASGQETAWVTGLSSAPVPARETPAPQSRVCIDPWFDLVYHALAHLPVAAADASTLMDEKYVRWIGAQFARRAAGGVLPPRMLVADAPLMAAAYDASQQGFLLHAWPLLFDRIDTFLESANVDFRQCTWADGEPGRLAAAMQAAMSPVLLDLFRAALVNEVACGYLAIWQEEAAPCAAAYRELFVAELNRLAADLPALGEVTWMLSYPLGAHGRLLRARPARRSSLSASVVPSGTWTNGSPCSRAVTSTSCGARSATCRPRRPWRLGRVVRVLKPSAKWKAGAGAGLAVLSRQPLGSCLSGLAKPLARSGGIHHFFLHSGECRPGPCERVTYCYARLYEVDQRMIGLPTCTSRSH